MTEYQYLTELQYSNDRKGPFRLYIYDRPGLHSGGQWFRKPPLIFTDEEITSSEAMKRTIEATTVFGYEVRICDGGDMLVYHWKDNRLLYPKPLGNFWKEIGAQ